MQDIHLGKKIQTLRTERGLSVRKLASAAGITASMLSQIENEQVNPSIQTLRGRQRSCQHKAREYECQKKSPHI